MLYQLLQPGASRLVLFNELSNSLLNEILRSQKDKCSRILFVRGTRIDKFIETGSGCQGLQPVGTGQLLFNGYRVSVSQIKHNSGD